VGAAGYSFSQMSSDTAELSIEYTSRGFLAFKNPEMVGPKVENSIFARGGVYMNEGGSE
jgi:hypothetical protein